MEWNTNQSSEEEEERRREQTLHQFFNRVLSSFDVDAATERMKEPLTKETTWGDGGSGGNIYR